MVFGLFTLSNAADFHCRRALSRGISILGLVVSGAVLAQSPSPQACIGDQECRVVHEACEKQNDCSDLKLKSGVVLTPMERCYVDLARRRCNGYNKNMAQCFLSGGVHIAGGCFHVGQGWLGETTSIQGKTFFCESGPVPPERQACDKLSSERPRGNESR